MPMFSKRLTLSSKICTNRAVVWEFEFTKSAKRLWYDRNSGMLRANDRGIMGERLVFGVSHDDISLVFEVLLICGKYLDEAVVDTLDGFAVAGLKLHFHGIIPAGAYIGKYSFEIVVCGGEISLLGAEIFRELKQLLRISF